MKSLVALSFFITLLIIVYIIKKCICANSVKDEDPANVILDTDTIDKIEPLELQLIQKEKERAILIEKYRQIYEDLGIDAAYSELQLKFEKGQINRATYHEQLDILLSKINLKEMDLDLF